jgi:hypothetical protein
MSDDTQRVIGAHNAKLDTHDSRLDRLEAKVDQLLAYQQQAKGGFRMLIAVGGIGGAAGAGLIKVLAVFAKATA